ncbi:hypothetical protein [Lentzea kentuckyensis]|uniref:hypothetical protein n=1 Tax=Lentzea kentuckyensis TaxID=360086 RepID=UPI00117AEFA6|nr:hypothetical protein [Lentzea kentuckyensis]
MQAKITSTRWSVASKGSTSKSRVAEVTLWTTPSTVRSDCRVGHTRSTAASGTAVGRAVNTIDDHNYPSSEWAADRECASSPAIDGREVHFQAREQEDLRRGAAVNEVSIWPQALRKADSKCVTTSCPVRVEIELTQPESKAAVRRTRGWRQGA